MTKVDNAAVLSTVKPNKAMLTWFNEYLTKWPSQWAGNKPTAEMLMVPLLLGKRPGVEAGHIAMCLRPEGCTVQQFQTAFSCGPANNYRRALVKAGWFNCAVQGKPYAFVLTFTAKGEAAVAKGIKALEAAAVNTAAAAPSKPAGKPKAKKAKVTKPKAESAPAAVTEAVVITQAEIDAAMIDEHNAAEALEAVPDYQ